MTAVAAATKVRPAHAPHAFALDEALARTWGKREHEAERKGARRLPAETVAEVRSSGVLASPVPVALGGSGLSLADCVTLLRQVARHAPATALALAMPLGNAATARIPAESVPASARADLAEGIRWTAEQAGKGRILAVANSEPGSGGDLANTKTVATKKAGKWHLTGRKAFATFGSDADYFLCAGKSGDAVDGYFVARDAPGMTVNDDWDGFGMRCSASVTLDLKDAPASALLGYPGALTGANARHWSTVLFGAVFVGVGEGALREACTVADAGSPSVRAGIGHAALGLEAAAGFLDSVAAQDAYPFKHGLRAQRAKTVAAQAALSAATTASVAGGGRSYRDGALLAKFVRDALAGPHLRPPLPTVIDAIADEWLAKQRPAKP
jgi:alkylation response protein AidB-like acyl-CoA dehydrogenase